MASEIIESTEEYDVYKVALGHLYVFNKDCKTGEFKGQKAGTSRMKYLDGVPPRPITIGKKYRGG